MATRRKVKSYTSRRTLGAKSKKPPVSTGSKVPTKYAIAHTMTKMKKPKGKLKATATKYCKISYKDFGSYTNKKCMFVSHENHGSIGRMFDTIAMSLTKSVLAKAHIYPGKQDTDLMVGPRTNLGEDAGVNTATYDNQNAAVYMRFAFVVDSGTTVTETVTYDVDVTNVGLSPDTYKPFATIAAAVSTMLQGYYMNPDGINRWLQSAQVVLPAANVALMAIPCVLNNLDDSEITFIASGMLKFQNVTPADQANINNGLTTAIDSNPLSGRIYTGKGVGPKIDYDLMWAGNKTLATMFKGTDPSGITNFTGNLAVTADTQADLGKIQHIPPGKELLERYTKEGTIYIGPGQMKFHKTFFKLKTTFRKLADKLGNDYPPFTTLQGGQQQLGGYTMFGLTLQHRHGEDDIHLGFQRDMELSSHVKIVTNMHHMTRHVTNDIGPITYTHDPVDVTA